MSVPHLVLYDGVCGLCDRLNRFVLRRDARGVFRFAPLQGRLARDLLRAHGRDPDDLGTLYLVSDYGSPRQAIHARSRAVLRILRELDGPWRRLAAIAGLLPGGLFDVAYSLVARTRYRFFGRYDQCPAPRPEWRDRFLDV